MDLVEPVRFELTKPRIQQAGWSIRDCCPFDDSPSRHPGAMYSHIFRPARPQGCQATNNEKLTVPFHPVRWNNCEQIVKICAHSLTENEKLPNMCTFPYWGDADDHKIQHKPCLLSASLRAWHLVGGVSGTTSMSNVGWQVLTKLHQSSVQERLQLLSCEEVQTRGKETLCDLGI